ncbi:MAG: metallophosphoesterase family protein [Chloroflexi bacterium]|nr:metallophosphoesterase family protein [Chloroflexota bacterium]
MRIGLVSDTHIPIAAKELPPELMEALQGVDLILHAGDIYALSVLDKLARIAPVLAARGDDDYGDTLIDKRVKWTHVLELEGKTLRLIHERPYSPAWWQNTDSSGQDGKPDIIVFGHEHRTVVEQVDGTLLINPGSPTFLNYLRGLGTIGLLDINSGKVDVQILQL